MGTMKKDGGDRFMLFTLDIKKTAAKSHPALVDFLVLGGGPAGLNAALYAKRKGMTTLVVAQDLGGQLRNTTTVDNYLGFINIPAEELIQRFVDHAEAQGVPLVSGVRILSFQKEGDVFLAKTEDGREFRGRTVLAALGGSPRKMGIPGEDKLSGKGVSYCATCDAPFFRDKTVVVAGGGNSAVEAAMDLAKWAKKVTIIHRSRFRADQILLDRMNAIPGIEVRLETQILEVSGDTSMAGLLLRNLKTGETETFPADGLFVEIGTIPNSSLFAGLADRNAIGELLVDENQKTSLEGLYAAGDITSQPHRQIIISAAEGAKAAMAASQYLHLKGR